MYYIGIDLGGTNIKAGVVDETGRILTEAYTKTLARRPYEDIVRDMGACVNMAISSAKVPVEGVASIGIGIPGLADAQSGRVVFCTNLGWHDIPLREEMQKYLDRPVVIDNDATVAGYAESIAGVSQGCDCSVFLTLGTGTGGGIVIGGRPWTGMHGIGSEIGHMTLAADGVPCTCGNEGCVERYTSATAIIRMARELCLTYPDSMMMQRAGGDIDRINAKTVIDAAKAGDPAATEAFDRYCRYLAMTINNIIALLDPDMIVLGGGVSHAGEFLLRKVREKLPRFLLYKNMPYARLELARLGNDAGIIGAAMIGKLAVEL
ncbi:MAG: ROK family glucokinase [Clostridia bacterium]|nr:ROK family glucokinase [Clostridia bacterium]